MATPKTDIFAASLVSMTERAKRYPSLLESHRQLEEQNAELAYELDWILDMFKGYQGMEFQRARSVLAKVTK